MASSVHRDRDLHVIKQPCLYIQWLNFRTDEFYEILIISKWYLAIGSYFHRNMLCHSLSTPCLHCLSKTDPSTSQGVMWKRKTENRQNFEDFLCRREGTVEAQTTVYSCRYIFFQLTKFQTPMCFHILENVNKIFFKLLTPNLTTGSKS